VRPPRGAGAPAGRPGRAGRPLRRAPGGGFHDHAGADRGRRAGGGGRMNEDLTALAGQVAERLLARAEKVAVAETSAGGLINHALTNVAGSSKWYAGGAVP